MSNQQEIISVSRSDADLWWVNVDKAIILDPGLSPKSRFIYAVLCTFSSPVSKAQWPTNEEVAQAAGVSVETVKKAYNEINSKAMRFVDYVRRTRFYEEERNNEQS